MPVTDPYFCGFNQALPDYWRFKEWEREFDGFVAKGDAPNLMLVRLAHDHTGSFQQGLDGVNTVEAELADNDYAVGLLVEKIAKSPFAKDTLIFVVEDDAQDGPDHVDAHRSIAFVAGPYVKHGAVVSRRYTTVNMVRTIEAVLGLAPMGLNDALAAPMADGVRSRPGRLELHRPGPGRAAHHPAAAAAADHRRGRLPGRAAALVGLVGRGDGRPGLLRRGPPGHRRATTARSGAGSRATHPTPPSATARTCARTAPPCWRRRESEGAAEGVDSGYTVMVGRPSRPSMNTGSALAAPGAATHGSACLDRRDGRPAMTEM